MCVDCQRPPHVALFLCLVACESNRVNTGLDLVYSDMSVKSGKSLVYMFYNR